ncbi:hypothetical protein AB0J90_02795 [Micromonospora sp. NPDC049523]|uniref:hypothetical protein n=1 Tax=Micromonospora sp. NPDC049523 TaxID=3155921 RepID=UPI003437A4E5
MLSRQVWVELTVAPGQLGSSPRTDTFRNFLHLPRRPVGVVHVVCWGYNEPWGGRNAAGVREARRTRKRKKGPVDVPAERLAYLRQYHLRLELQEFVEVCDKLAAVWKPGRNKETKFWLIVALAKADLYPDDLDRARAYYGPDAKSEFGRTLRRLQQRVPGLECRVVPVSSGPTTYGEDLDLGFRVEPALDATQSTKMLDDFWIAVEEFCGAR